MKVKNHDADYELMQRVARGEQPAFRTLYDGHKARVYGICLRMMGKGRGADDMTQEVWLRVIKNANMYRPTGTLAAWLSQLTRNACLNEMRAAKPEDFVEDLESIADKSQSMDADSPFKGLTDNEELEQAFQALPSQQRAVLLMAVYEELSHSEIAKELNISVGAVKQLIVRGKENMRAHFAEKA